VVQHAENHNHIFALIGKRQLRGILNHEFGVWQPALMGQCDLLRHQVNPHIALGPQLTEQHRAVA
jgi:hypothetical protein